MPTPPVQNAEDLKGKKGLRRLVNATRYSMQGFKAAYRHEAAFREETLVSCLLIPLAILLPISWFETAVLISSILLVLLAEIFNSALEAVVDRIGPELHPLSGRAKDMGSAAVFLALIIAVVLWLSVIVPLGLSWVI